MNTSYYAHYSGDNGVSISIKCPPWFKGRQYSKLFPPYWLLKKYKEDGDHTFYSEQYRMEILDRLDPQSVYNELGDVVLLCYETPDKFCHRHLVARWFNDTLGIVVSEI